MKQLKVNTEKYQRIEKGFKEWLKVNGYVSSTVENMPLIVREFFHWLETQNNIYLENLTGANMEAYFLYLRTRPKYSTNGKTEPCTKRPGNMSLNNLHKHLQGLKKLSAYLNMTGQTIFEIDIRLPKQQRTFKEILTREQIKSLYEVCDNTIPLGVRDRVMLAIFYGCGLRRTEGAELNMTDILWERNLIYVRKGKHYKERYVPITEEIKKELENYVYYARPVLIKDPNQQAFFISERGTRTEGQSLYLRLKQLAKKIELPFDIGLHHLRHSVATHLLQSGMKLSLIAKFLGHDSIESTQIYTQIIYQKDEKF